MGSWKKNKMNESFDQINPASFFMEKEKKRTKDDEIKTSYKLVVGGLNFVRRIMIVKGNVIVISIGWGWIMTYWLGVYSGSRCLFFLSLNFSRKNYAVSFSCAAGFS